MGTDMPIRGSGSTTQNCSRVRWWALIASAALFLLMTIAVARAQAGGLDQGFGTEGKVVLDADGRWLSDLGVDRAGRTLALLTSEPAIVRFLPDGSLDPDFGEGGIHELPRETPFEFGYPVAGELALDSRGRILVQLVAAVDEGCSGPDYLIRLHANGAPDQGFGVDGALALEGVDSSFVPSAGMELDGRDRIYLGGSDRNCSSNDPAVVRLKPDGQLDNSYGDGGVFSLRGHRLHTYTSFVSDIDIDRRGRAALAARGYKKVGTDPDGSCDCVRGSVAIRLKQNGELQRSFGRKGVQRAFNLKGLATNVQLAGRRTVLAGYRRHRGDRELIVARLTRKGRNDRRFNRGRPKLIRAKGEQTSSDLLLAHRRLIVAGTSGSQGSGPDFIVGMLKLNGRLDRGFGERGRLTTDFGGGNYAESLAAAPGRKFVLGGERHVPSRERPLNLARYER